MNIIKQQNALIGLALGDAWGADTEFLPFEDFQQDNYLAETPQKDADIIRVTDDTHMSIHVFQALNTISEDPAFLSLDDYENTPTKVTQNILNVFVDEFLKWYKSPLNTHDRAPGNTCMTSMEMVNQLAHSPFEWGTDDIENDSMGSGTIMRSPWIGVHPGIPDESIEYVSNIQSLLTHKHPEALTSAALAVLLVRELVTDRLQLENILERTLEIIEYKGWNELGTYFSNAELAVHQMTQREILSYDPCSDLGGGWIAPSTIALAVSIAQTYHNQPVDALRRSALTGGDSDTIGAVTGALIGAGQPEPILDFMPLFQKLESPFKEEIMGFMRQLESAPHM